MKKHLLLFTLIMLCHSLWSQKIVNMELQETLTKDELSALFFGFGVNNGIEVYKMLYETSDTDGTLDTASGL